MIQSSFLRKSLTINTAVMNVVTKSPIDELLTELQSDLEKLLNTRRQPFSVSGSFKELNRCVLEYGLDDFSHFLSFSQVNLQKMAIDIEKTLRLFEPRFSDVKIDVAKNAQDNKKVILFKMIASLNLGNKAFSVYSHLNFHMQNQIYRFLNWGFDYAR